MILYRLTRTLYANDLTGAGAKTYGGRWNSKGNAMLYLASGRALAVLEVLVHLSPLIIPDDYCMVSIEAPDNFEVADVALLQSGRRQAPNEYNFKQIGDRFLRQNNKLLLKVPSVIVTGEYNFLANPLHPMASKLKVVQVEPFSFDARLLG